MISSGSAEQWDNTDRAASRWQVSSTTRRRLGSQFLEPVENDVDCLARAAPVRRKAERPLGEKESLTIELTHRSGARW